MPSDEWLRAWFAMLRAESLATLDDSQVGGARRAVLTQAAHASGCVPFAGHFKGAQSREDPSRCPWYCRRRCCCCLSSIEGSSPAAAAAACLEWKGRALLRLAAAMGAPALQDLVLLVDWLCLTALCLVCTPLQVLAVLDLLASNTLGMVPTQR